MELVPAEPSNEHDASLLVTYANVAEERDAIGVHDGRMPHIEALIGRMQGDEADRLLEVGGGTGNTAAVFAAAGLNVVMTDLSPDQVMLARQKGLTASAADIRELPFDDASFDAVWAENCLLHIANRDMPDALSEIRRVLVPDGLFVLTLWGGIDSEGIYEDDFYRPRRFFSLRSDDSLRNLVEETFEVESFECPFDRESDDRLHLQVLYLRPRT
ncbi:demethylrebeccamycin-D-glucose O-methyltransferase [bacterium BMS3Bbin02]|nr:demethylrebeccamycin-D-glucose O-methyltransferase [bacterium BMS3Bbin02]